MRSAQPGLVGRESELDALTSFLAAEDGGSNTLCLEGEAGIGKTTLWRAGVDLAAERGLRVLVARPTSAEQELPFAGLGDLLDADLADVLDELPLPQRQALEVALLLAEPHGAPPAPRAIAAAVLSSLRALARLRPVLVAVDDTQWLDRPTAATLEFAVRRLQPRDGVRFLLSRRLDADGPGPLASGEGVKVLEVGPLSLGALHRVITGQLGRPLHRPVLTRVHVASGGNPFYALELARFAERRGARADPDELPLPASLAEALRERLDVLPADTRAALLAVAALAAPTLDALQAALGPDARSILTPAIDTGIVVVDVDYVRFAHPLTGAAVYAETWPEERRACHRRLAALATDPDEHVRHLALASEGPDRDLAEALEEAARRARRRGAPEAAATFVEQAWRATPSEDHDAAWRRAVLSAEHTLQSGDMGRFRELTEQILTLARPGDERSFAFALISIEPIGDETAIGWLDKALVEAESLRQRQSVESDYVTEATIGGDLAAGARHANEALRLAEEIAEPEMLADALGMVARHEQLLGRGLRRDLVARVDALDEIGATDRLEATVNLVRATVSVAGTLATADEFADARRRGEALHDLLEQRALVQSLPEVLRFRAELECLAGDWVAAGSLATMGDELAEQTGREASRRDLLYPRAFVAAHTGDTDTARALALEGLGAAEATHNHRTLLRHLSVLGFLELSLSDAAAAAGYLERAADVAAAAGYIEPNWLRFHGDLGEVMVETTRLEEAAAVLALLDECGATTRYPWTLATAERLRGQLAAAHGEHEQAERALSQALELGQRLGNPFELARTFLELGRSHRRTLRRVEAKTAITEALQRFEATGASLWADTARSRSWAGSRDDVRVIRRC